MNSMPGLNPVLQFYGEALIAWANDQGYSPRVTSTYRSYAQQSRLYQKYLTALEQGAPTLPAAPPGTSKHEQGLAFDLVTTPYEALWTLGQVWNSWGGRWFSSDPVHFEA